MTLKKGLAALACAVLTAGAAAADANFTDYGTARGWVVQAVDYDGSFARCEAMKDDVAFMLTLSVEGWMVTADAVPGNPAEVAGMIDINRASAPATFYQMDDGRYAAYLDDGMVTALRDGSHLTLEVAGQITDGPLSGSAAAMGKLEECLANGGATPGGAAMDQAAIDSDATRLGAGCPALGEFASPPSDNPAHAVFVNNSDVAVTIYWIDFDGQIQEYAGTLPGESWEVETWAGHYWLAKDFDGTCHGGTMVTAAGQNRFVFN